MYNDARTVVRMAYGNSEVFEAGVVMHQGSELSPLLMVRGESLIIVRNVGKWPCVVCGKGVDCKSIQYTAPNVCSGCMGYVAKNGSLCKTSKSFLCKFCLGM